MHALLKHGILKARAYAKNRDCLLQHADARWMTNGEPPFAALTLHYHGVSRNRSGAWLPPPDCNWLFLYCFCIFSGKFWHGDV